MGNSTGNADKKSTKTGKNDEKEKKTTEKKTTQRKITMQLEEINQQIGGDDMKTYQQPKAKEAKQFWSKIWKPKEYKKAEWIRHMTRDLEGLEVGLKAEIHIDWRKGSKGTGELLYIDQHILNESKTKRKNLAMAWIDYNMICSHKAG